MRVDSCAILVAGALVPGWIFAVPALSQPLTPVQLLQLSGAADDRFASDVALDADTMIVGSPRDDVAANTDQGSAHIYRRTSTGWELEATLTAADGAARDLFGSRVAISGDTVVVAAVNDRDERESAYVFVRSPQGTWMQQAKLTANAGPGVNCFACSVAISGDTAVVGAAWDDVNANWNQGSAYVFVRSDEGTWTQQAKITAADGAARKYFGSSVAISGDTAVVGGFLDPTYNLDPGSAYIFVRSGTTWTQQAKITAADGATNDQFGDSVALSGDTAVIGANSDTIDENYFQGSAYIFVRSPESTSWTQQAKLTASDGAAGAFFGVSVAISGDTAVVGANWDRIGSNAEQGSAYVFVRSLESATWTQQAKLTAPDGAAFDRFGSSVTISGDTAVVAAPVDDVGMNTEQGSTWVFTRSGSSWVGPPCAAEIDGVPGVGLGDFLAFFNCYDAEQACADVDGNPGVDLSDFLAFFNAYDSGC